MELVQTVKIGLFQMLPNLLKTLYSDFFVAEEHADQEEDTTVFSDLKSEVSPNVRRVQMKLQAKYDESDGLLDALSKPDHTIIHRNDIDL